MIPTNELIARYRQGLSAGWLLALATSRHPDIEMLEDMFADDAVNEFQDRYDVWQLEIVRTIQASPWLFSFDDGWATVPAAIRAIAKDQVTHSVHRSWSGWGAAKALKGCLSVHCSPDNIMAGLIIGDLERLMGDWDNILPKRIKYIVKRHKHKNLFSKLGLACHGLASMAPLPPKAPAPASTASTA